MIPYHSHTPSTAQLAQLAIDCPRRATLSCHCPSRNAEAQYYGVFSSNHEELGALSHLIPYGLPRYAQAAVVKTHSKRGVSHTASAYFPPITAWMDSAKQSAQAHAAKGGITCPANAMHFSCHLAPWGYQSHDQSEYMHCEEPSSCYSAYACTCCLLSAAPSDASSARPCILLFVHPFLILNRVAAAAFGLRLVYDCCWCPQGMETSQPSSSSTTGSTHKTKPSQRSSRTLS
jgi:hypothetical protein